MGEAHGAVQITLAFLAVILATLNIVGGFVVTDRMLEMFKAKPGRPRDGRKRGPDRGRHADRTVPVSLEHRHRPGLPDRRVGFIVALKGLSSPSTPATGTCSGRPRRRGRRLHVRLPRGTSPHPQSGAHPGGHGHRRGHRRTGGPPGEDDGDAPDGGHLQRGRRRGGRLDLHRGLPHRAPGQPAVYRIAEVLFGVLVGCVSFSGSAIAFAKLQELMTGRPVTYPAQQVINGIVGLGILGLAIGTLVTGSVPLLVATAVLSLVLGVIFVLPIGGADVPGPHLAAQLLHRPGRGGLGLHPQQQPADHRRHPGRRLGHPPHPVDEQGHGPVTAQHPVQRLRFGGDRRRRGGRLGAEARPVKAGTPEDIGVLLAYARKVVIIPGYGLAVAQAQHAARELADLLMERGVEVFYAIHPVAGRMPGHMNVLLAEANVPYDELKEMDEANPEMATADVALVVGANDTVNPAAKNTAGQPHLRHAHHQRRRGGQHRVPEALDAPGFAGIDNELLFDQKTTMLFGDAKDTLTKLVAAVKEA